MMTFSKAKAAFIKDYIREVLRETNGNMSESARIAGKDRKDFYTFVKKCGVDPASFRPKVKKAKLKKVG
jgi:two-component system response regulator GlrR